MFAVFASLLVVGVGLLLLQSLGGHDADVDGPSLSVEHDAGHDAPWLLIANLRFWAFACAGTGAIGTLGLWLTDSSRAVVAVVAAVCGVALGLLVVWSLQRLHHDGGSELTSVESTRGRLGRIVLPTSVGGRGKVRIEIKGTLVDLVAVSEAALEAGAEVVITEIEGTEARVERVPRELSS